jgi:hypothetical protein
MDKAQIKQFLYAIGAERVTSDGGSWVRASCPLAPWFHEGHKDANPSFGIKEGVGDDSPYYHCFACGSHGSLIKLLHNLQFLSGVHLKEASALLSSDASFFTQKEVTRARKRIVVDKFAKHSDRKSREVRSNPLVPDDVLAKYPLLVDSDLEESNTVMRWLTQVRKLSVQSIADAQLRLYMDSFIGYLGVLFPVIGRDGAVRDLWVRMIHDKSFFRLTKKLSDSPVDYSAPNLWFGGERMNADKPVIFVEGQIDALRLETLGIKNVVACGPGGPSYAQMASIHVSVAYFGFDADKGGRGFAKRAYENMSALTMFFLDWSVVGKKDPGELDNLSQFKRVFEKRRRLLRVPKIDLTGNRRRKSIHEKSSTFKRLTMGCFCDLTSLFFMLLWCC